MFARRKVTKRFNLLLLEDEEDYVADWVASCKWPKNVEGNWQGLPSLPGRLRLCTKSLFFEPDDVRVPIVRLEFASVQQLEAESMQSFLLGITKVTKMKPNMADVPYVVERSRASTWLFTLTYAKLDSFMPLAQEQLVLSKLPASERLSLQDAAVKAREDATSFDTSRLVEYSERLVWEGPAVQLSPLVREPGRLAVTDQRVYFQPLHNITGDTPVRSHPLAAVAAVVRRRSSLRPIGLELFMLSPNLETHLQQNMSQYNGPFWDAPSAFFCFRSEAERDKLLAALTAQPTLGVAVRKLMPGSTSTGSTLSVPLHSPAVPSPSQEQLTAAGQLLEATGGWLQRVMCAWQQGKVSNFDYLLYLNLAAGRSFNDLAQWPVFPWVLKDYSSAVLDLSNEAVFRDLTKPMGAQNPARLEVFRQRFHDMESIMQHVDAAGDMPKPFMYGTHYSTPGYVMFWLVRAAPGHMLRLQAGKFDAPDRLFNSLQDSWDSATTSTTDVKELIPEFYMPGGDFLVNGSQLAFGIRQNGTPVNNVVLPPWANSPEDLLAKHRAALESPHASAQLHHWIDLIFGYKQTGPAAVDADNVFYHLTYEGAVDIAKVTALQELKALETQINEFGQTPKQLFTHPHPPRLVQPPTPDSATVFSHSSSSGLLQPGPDLPPGSELLLRSGAGSSGAVAAAQGSMSSSSSKSRLKAGGEDAAGGALCFALLTTILAAAAPDLQPPDAAGAGGSSTAAAAAGDDDDDDDDAASGLSLSPVSSSDLLSATCKTPSVMAALPGNQQGTAVAAPAAAAAGNSNAADLLSQQQSGGIKAMLSRFKDGATAAAGSAAARVANTMQGGVGNNSSNNNNNSSSIMGLAGMPVSLSSKAGSSMTLSLSWMQQQFAEGLALASSSSSSSSSNKAPAATTAAGDTVTLGAAASGSKLSIGALSSSSSATSSSSSSRIPHTKGGSSSCRHWPRSLPDGLLVKKSLRLQPDPLTAVAATEHGAVFCVGHNGLLRVLEVPQLGTFRSAKLDEDFLCISLLPVAPSAVSLPAGTAVSASKAAAAAAAGTGGSVGTSQLSQMVLHGEVHLPLMLAGAQSGRVVAYAATSGRLLGQYAAHEDAVSSVLQLGQGGSRIVTASYDCTVKVWDVAEGRQPWSSTLPLPQLQLPDHESAVWAVSGSASGQLLVTGTDEGVVAAWDLRTHQQIWSTQVSSDYVGGVSLLPGGNYVAAAAADGTVSLLEWRRAGVRIASASCDAPLRCCTCDGNLMISGTENGQLLMWNLAQLTGQDVGLGPGDNAGFSLAGPDGLYPAVSCPSKSAVNGVGVGVLNEAGGPGSCNVLAALDDGLLVLFQN